MSADSKYPPNGLIDNNGTVITTSNSVSSTDAWVSAGSSSRPLQVKPRYEGIQELVDRIQQKLNRTKSISSLLEKSIENLQTFNFAEGDVVISKSAGTGIVSGIGIGEGKHSSAIDEQFPDSFYVVLATKNGFIKVPPEDIMPYTTASKILHERG